MRETTFYDEDGELLANCPCCDVNFSIDVPRHPIIGSHRIAVEADIIPEGWRPPRECHANEPLATDSNLTLLDALHALQSVGIRQDLQDKIVGLLWKADNSRMVRSNRVDDEVLETTE